ncbi:MAG: primosomal protein N' [Puniceicoccales bacterium]|jgi:primosomal protein N' (replication factor Y)|nr:primosomal protein N' [Puniceicoccales bacterium]
MNLARLGKILESPWGQMDALCVSVELFDAVGKPLCYAVPPHLLAEISEGALVRVPLNNRFTTGVVTNTGKSTFEGKLKPIGEVIYHLPPDLMALARWLCRYYGADLSSALGVIVPREMRKKRKHSPVFTGEIKNSPSGDTLADSLIPSLLSRKFRTVLLQEWNFCRRAEIYITLAACALNSGENALLLVPEISKVERLAQLMGRQIPHFPWHGRLSLGDRTAIWNGLIENAGPIAVIGTPAAVFLPIAAPRLIIVDDEEGDAYKCEKIPRFHRRDCAVCRAWLNQALCVLGSGAPSLESIQACRRGKFQYIPSDGPAVGSIGNIRVIDAKNSARNRFSVTPTLEAELRKCIQSNEQGILILNRLGYERCIFCHRCNLELSCPKCDGPMALWRGRKQRFCPACSYVERHTHHCPNCHNPSLRARGAGIERMEEILGQIFPHARILSCDHSIRSSPKKIRAFEDAMRSEKIDIIIGTHAAIDLIHSPRVGLVGILNADQELQRSDFRAGERAFQTLARICHICASSPGQSKPIPLILQTRDPANIILQAVIGGDPSPFYETELADRKVLGYPPHRHLIQQVFLGKSNKEVECFAAEWVTLLETKMRASESFQLKGPRKLQPHKGNERHCLWYLTTNPIFLMEKLQEMREAMPQSKEVDYFWDVDARDLL